MIQDFALIWLVCCFSFSLVEFAEKSLDMFRVSWVE